MGNGTTNDTPSFENNTVLFAHAIFCVCLDLSLGRNINGSQRGDNPPFNASDVILRKEKGALLGRGIREHRGGRGVPLEPTNEQAFRF